MTFPFNRDRAADQSEMDRRFACLAVRHDGTYLDYYMHSYEHDFISFALGSGALTFGEFTLKSGRVSPYFFNTGQFDSGERLARLGRFYAEAIVACGLRFDQLYGPAYKGIPLVAAVAVALAEHFGRDLPYVFNRKEAKDHGEGGITVGAPLDGQVLIIDDVISAGTSVRESVEIIRAAGAHPAGVAISLDRQERGEGPRSAIEEVEAMGLQVISVTRMDSIVAYLSSGTSTDLDAYLAPMQQYRSRYGVHAESSR